MHKLYLRFVIAKRSLVAGLVDAREVEGSKGQCARLSADASAETRHFERAHMRVLLTHC